METTGDAGASREELTAFHEAGHAVASKALGLSIPEWITILPDRNAPGRCQTDVWRRWSVEGLTLGREWAGRVAVFTLSGHAAEQQRRGDEIITAEAMLALPLDVKAASSAGG